MFPDAWGFLSDPDNQATLAWLGGGAMAIVGGLWTVFTYLHGHKSGAPSPTRRSVQVDSGIGAGGDVLVEGPVTIHQTRLPKAALTLAALGLLLLAYAILNSGDRISVEGGSYIGGDQKDSTVIIHGDKRAKP